MIDLDDVPGQIDALHAQAEEAASLSRTYAREGDTAAADKARKEAERALRSAARLREQIGGEA